MSPEEVVKVINEAGNDFTVEEIVEFGENLKVAATQAGELTEDNLDEVSGGLLVAAACVNRVSIAIPIGVTLRTNWKW